MFWFPLIRSHVRFVLPAVTTSFSVQGPEDSGSSVHGAELSLALLAPSFENAFLSLHLQVLPRKPDSPHPTPTPTPTRDPNRLETNEGFLLNAKEGISINT